MAVLNVSKHRIGHGTMPIHRILADVTGESRLEVALPLALKDLLRLKLREAEEQLYAFEKNMAWISRLSRWPGTTIRFQTNTVTRSKGTIGPGKLPQQIRTAWVRSWKHCHDPGRI